MYRLIGARRGIMACNETTALKCIARADFRFPHLLLRSIPLFRLFADARNVARESAVQGRGTLSHTLD